MSSEIAAKARFDRIRYAQLWEDADVLLAALGTRKGGTLVSICSAGDNALALLLLDPARVIAADLSAAQIACLQLRMAMYRILDHAAFLELMGSRPSYRRGALLNDVMAALPEPARLFWAAQREAIEAHGVGGIGKFERYFRILRLYFMPLVHSQRTIDALFLSRSRAERKDFMAKRWNTWRWRLLLQIFFSRFTMGRLGRDPAFFDHVEGSVADHVARRAVHATVDLDPADNPFLYWIFKGTHGDALPLAWRAEHYATIRDRLDRLDIWNGSIESLLATGVKVDGFNLSDIFEYMSADAFASVYGSLIAAANPGARLAYWNMMAPRRAPQQFAARVHRLQPIEDRCKAMDKAFFYSDFVVEEVAA